MVRYEQDFYSEMDEGWYEALSQVKGKVAISSYHCALMDSLYKNWNVHEEGAKKAHSVKTERTEVLWTNC